MVLRLSEPGGALCDYALHLGLTEAGMGSPRALSARRPRMAILLQQGIGDTIRVSLTPEPGGDRTKEVIVAQEVCCRRWASAQFLPIVSACPGCGRTTSTTFQTLAKDIQHNIDASMPEWREKYPGVENLSIAVMGCIVNRPGRIQTRRYRHFPARHRRNPGRPGLCRRPQGRHAARRRRRRPVQENGRRLYRKALRQRPDRKRRNSLWQKFPAHPAMHPKPPDLLRRYEEHSFEEAQKHLLPFLPDSAPASAMDIGAGTGRDAAGLARRGWDVIAVEPVAEMPRGRAKTPSGTQHHLDR